MVENENIDNTNSNDQGAGGRRRRSIFGGRRVTRPADTAETPVFAEEREVAAEQVAVEQAAAGIDVQAEVAEPTEETPDATAVPVDAATAAADGHEPPALPDRHGEQPEAAPAYVPGLPPTTLLFQAPDILPLPPLPDDEPTGSVRRRSRRRAGENGRNEPNDPANTVVKVRTPREPELITEPQKVKGSTRLEAKKQRRRDGRDAGRRRPVITEAEFLARRESVDRQMVVRSKGGRIQIGVLEDKVLVEHYVARSQEASLIGNVYLGRVQNVLPSMEAAFVDIGRGRNAVLYSGEVDWDAVETGNQPRRIELALKAETACWCRSPRTRSVTRAPG